MPVMVKIGPAKGYKLPSLKPGASADDAAAHKNLVASWDAIKAGGVKEVPIVGANEALQLSKGMYEILAAEEAPKTATAILMPEDMSPDELKLTALQLGVDLKKPMKKAELVALVRKAMDNVQLLDDDSEEDET